MTSPLHTAMPLSASEPSFFELFMADRLHRAMEPSLQQLIAAATSSIPSAEENSENGALAWRWRLRWLVAELRHNLDEATAFALGCVQARSLWAADALLAERLYGLRRAAYVGSGVGSSVAPRGLSGADRWRTLAWAVVVPWGKRKLDQAHAATRQRAVYQPSLGLAAQLLLWLFPWLHAAYEGSALGAQLLHLAGAYPHFYASQHHLPLVGLGQSFVRTAPLPTTAADAVHPPANSLLPAAATPKTPLPPIRPAAAATTAAASPHPGGAPAVRPAPGGSSARAVVVFAVVLYKVIELSMLALFETGQGGKQKTQQTTVRVGFFLCGPRPSSGGGGRAETPRTLPALPARPTKLRPGSAAAGWAPSRRRRRRLGRCRETQPLARRLGSRCRWFVGKPFFAPLMSWRPKYTLSELCR
jgi:hypothetical protein